MKIVYRYNMMAAFETPKRTVTLSLPKEHTFLHLALEPQSKPDKTLIHTVLTDFGCLSAWFCIDPDTPVAEYVFHVVGTGIPIIVPEPPITLIPLGSMVGSLYTWHLFEERIQCATSNQDDLSILNPTSLLDFAEVNLVIADRFGKP